MVSNISGNLCDIFGGHNDLKASSAAVQRMLKDTLHQNEIYLAENTQLANNMMQMDKDKATILQEKSALELSLTQAEAYMKAAKEAENSCKVELSKLQADGSEEATLINNEHPKTSLAYDQKRYITDEYGVKAYVKYDVREFISTGGALLLDAIGAIYRLYSPKTEKELAEACWTWLMADRPSLNARYRADDYFGTPWNDFWQFSNETIVLQKGDCEDFAILWASLCRVAGIPAYKVRVMLGMYTSGGHSWGEYYDSETKEWLLIEGTMSHKFGEGLSKPPLQTYQSYFAFNDKYTWKIRDGITFGELISK